MSVYKIGNGPSSSHTVGPFHAAQIFGARYPDADRYRVTLPEMEADVDHYRKIVKGLLVEMGIEM